MTVRFPVGLEQGSDGHWLVHSFTLPGCVAQGAERDAALDALPAALGTWLTWAASLGEVVPPPEAELEVAVDEWVETDAEIASGESTAIFDHDRAALADAEIDRALRWLGALRGRTLTRVKRLPPEQMDALHGGTWTVRRALEELAYSQWWTLSRLRLELFAEPPRDHTLARLDTAMAFVVRQMSHLAPEERDRVVEADDGELWTPRKVLRRLLWLEWSLGRAVERALLSRTPDAS